MDDENKTATEPQQAKSAGAASSRQVPGDIEQAIIISRYEILRFIRGWRLIGLLVMTILIVALLWIVPIALKSDTSTDPLSYAGTYTGFVSILIILSVTFFGADSLVGEFQNKTVYLIFPNPVKRDAIFAGKFIASTVCAYAIVGAYYGLTAVATLSSTHGVPLQLGQSFLLALMFTTAAMAVAFLISALMQGTTGANVLTFFLFLIIFSIIDSLLAVAGIKPSASLTFAGATLTNVMSSPYPVDSVIEIGGGPNGQGGFTMHQYYSPLGAGIAVMTAYLLVCGIIALFFFRRREAKN